MVANVSKFKGKMAENGYNNKQLAGALGMSEATLRRKLKADAEFNIGESVKVKEILNLSTDEYLAIFIG